MTIAVCVDCENEFKKGHARTRRCPSCFKTILCPDCSVRFERKSGNQKRCKGCSEKHYRERIQTPNQRAAVKEGRKIGWFNCAVCGAETERLGPRGDGHRKYCIGCSKKHKVLYRCMASHYNSIIRLAKFPGQQRPGYVGMPFYDSWNPDRGGSLLTGANWLLENLGYRPEGETLHVVNHELGFVPGNLEWTYPRKQAAEQMFKIIADLKHRVFELEEELKKYKQ